MPADRGPFGIHEMDTDSIVLHENRRDCTYGHIGHLGRISGVEMVGGTTWEEQAGLALVCMVVLLGVLALILYGMWKS